MSSVLRERLAAGGKDTARIVAVPLNEWTAHLNAVAPPKDGPTAQLLAELRQGAAGAAGAGEVGIHAHQLAAVLDLPLQATHEKGPAKL
jgi:hypothetical protein